MRICIPEVHRLLGAIELRSSANGISLPTFTYQSPGEFVYVADLPMYALKEGDAINVHFQLNKALPPHDQERRELGLIVSLIDLV